MGKFLMSAAVSALALGAATMPAAAQPYDGPRYDGCRSQTTAGTVGGAIIGGVIGNQFGRGGGRTAATVGGVILGGIAGNAIARDACLDDRADAYYYNNAYTDAFDEPEYGQTYSWHNPHTGDYGSVTPVREYYDESYGPGPCREFHQKVYINGERAEAYGVACRQDDGSWRIVNS